MCEWMNSAKEKRVDRGKQQGALELVTGKKGEKHKGDRIRTGRTGRRDPTVALK